MARKKRYDKRFRKEEEAPAAEVESTEVAETPIETEGKKPNLIPYFVIFLLGFLLYVNTVPFDYVLDDKLYITANEFTKKGIDGISDHWENDLMTGFFGKKKSLVEGGRYRPLPLTTHALEWEIFGNNPHVSHFINIILYGMIGVLLLLIFQLMMPDKSGEKRWWWTLPFIATALFMAHPLHTEVGANIKSRDELMGMIFALLAMRSVLLYANTPGLKQLLLSGLWFFLSLTCRESSLIFLGVIPLALIFFSKTSFKHGAISLLPMLGVLGAYLVLRTAVYSDLSKSMDVAEELMNQPYLLATTSEYYASIFFTMGLYIKLLFWPHPLTHDYYPFHPFKTFEELSAGSSFYADWSEPMSIVAVIIYAALGIYGVVALVKRLQKKPADIVGFGILLYLGTFILFSNLLFEIGAFMNERWMFTPSIGFCLIIAWLIREQLGKKVGETAAMAVLAVIMLGYSAKTIHRNYAWESDHSLAFTDVGTSDGSAKVKMTMGSELLEDAQAATDPSQRAALLNQAERYCKESLAIYPEYFPPLDILGNIYYEKGEYEYSVYYFQRAVNRKGNDQRLIKNLEAVGNKAAQSKDYKSATAAFETAAKLFKGNNRSRVYSSLGELYGKELNQPEAALKYLRLSIKADDRNPDAYQKIGIIKAMRNEPDSALIFFETALEIAPDNARVMLNLAILYRGLGNQELYSKYMSKAVELDPSLKPKG